MKHDHAATAQIGLSFLIVGGYLAIVAAEGLRYIQAGTASSIKDVLFLVATFWFQRQRTTDPPTPTTTQEGQPK